MRNDADAGKAVLFDVDGTLLDTIPLIVETYQYIYHKWLNCPGDMTEILSGIGVPLEDYFRRFPAELAESMKADYLNFNRNNLDTHVGIFLQVHPMLAALKAREIPMGIVTSKRMETARYSLCDFGLESYFQVIIAKESTQVHKPEAEPVLEGMRQLGLTDPGRVVFIGDSLHDLLCARNAGCRSAIVDWTAMPVAELQAACPDLWLTGTSQLLSFLDTI